MLPFHAIPVFVDWKHNRNKKAFMPVSVITILLGRVYIVMWYMLYKTNTLIATVMRLCCG